MYLKGRQGFSNDRERQSMAISRRPTACASPAPHHRSRYGSSASGCQNGPDLVDAQRRRVEALVGPHGLYALTVLHLPLFPAAKC